MPKPPPVSTRTEQDSLGPVEVPADAYYGAQTQRAIGNFPVSGERFPRPFIRALGLIKKAAAETNAELKLLEPRLAKAVAQAAGEVAEGRHDASFPLDVFQTGSATSTNMNANEVIANRAIEILGGTVGSKKPVHPNDHVNLGQSSNDVIPTAAHLAALLEIHGRLLPALDTLHRSLAKKAKAFDGVVKLGRTHLQDATPVRLGQVFGGYATQIANGRRRVERAAEDLGELALGGTAVGTGLNRHPKFPELACKRLSKETGLALREAPDHFEAQGARDALVFASGALRTVAASLFKIANDIRFMASGPNAGLGEIFLPELQPGSSIMPGKVNPVLCEVATQVAAQVVGNDAAVAMGGATGNFELNVMIPVMIRNVLHSAHLLANTCDLFARRCVDGITANEKRCRDLAESSDMIVTGLAPHIGYDKAAGLAKEARKTGKTIRQLVTEGKLLPPAVIDKALDLRRMTEPGLPEKSASK